MDGPTTILLNPEVPSEEAKVFAFDHSYWSHDGFKELEDGRCVSDSHQPNGNKFADQETVYNDLGRDVLHNAWDGYNASLFAYGQTGSGKSYSVVGYGVNTGIVPRLCEELFQGIDQRRQAGNNSQYEVRFSMLEIYNEIVRDLLSQAADKKKGLKVREHPKKGFYAEGLQTFLVTNYKDIEAKINEGTTNRSIASTNMNATSSRAHTIVGITFIQKTTNSNGQETAKTSLINLVDLAGSERASLTGATGDRLKEGAAINQSLSCLGNCIHALAERANGRNARVPYRDSVLTRLLINALGGNSKTVMIAAISPADINYEETLSTLRYADRAKQIKTVASVNMDPTEKIIRELREENDKLKKILDKGNADIPAGPGITIEETQKLKKKWEEEMKAAMAENEREMKQLRQSYEDKLMIAAKQKAEEQERVKAEEEKKEHPHLSNLNFDPQLTGKIIYIIKPGQNTIGKGTDVDIGMMGPSIQEKHAVITLHNHGGISLEKGCNEARILQNGDLVTSKVYINHNDRLVFGTTQLYVFNNPEQLESEETSYPEVTYEIAQEEIAAKAGMNLGMDDASRETALLNKDMLELLPCMEEANSISEELDKRIKFEMMLVSPQILGKVNGATEPETEVDYTSREVFVKVRNLETGQEYEWPKDKFLNRLYVMKEMYQNYEAGEDWEVPEESDPFLEDVDAEIRIGSVQVYLQPLAFMVELKEQLEILDYKGTEAGRMNVEVVPCSPDGLEYTEHDDMFVDNPSELIGRQLSFIVKILGCRGLPTRFTDIVCKYKVFLDEEDSFTEVISDTSNPDFNHRKVFSFQPVTQQFVDYLRDGFMMVTVWGKQVMRKSVMAKSDGKNTKEMFQADMITQANSLMSGFKMNGRVVDPNKQSIIVELLLMKKQQARQQQRLDNIRRLVETAQNMKKRKVPVSLLQDLLNSTSPESAEELLSRLAAETDEDDNERGSSICSML